ncbi:unnamed protein product [Blepharisma stoltei]|uniref:sphingomyelin phosphodiesterase n=1 Tax=Blepharisma stoltei TaxID=1481888 RepID=A0AAU9ISV8_9CILI|nr:unnamed protein product [Blepharisma stoltei]
MSQTKLLTLNLFMRPPLVHNKNWDFKNQRLSYFISKIIKKYDIICLQETYAAYTSRQKKLLHEAANHNFLYHAISPLPKIFSTHIADCGLVILSKHKILESTFRPFNDSVYPDKLAYKGALYAKILVNSKPLHLFNVHLQSKHPTKSSKKYLMYRLTRRKQLIDLRNFVDEKIGLAEEPGFICGDLNVDGREELKPPVFKDIECLDDYEHLSKLLLRGKKVAMKDLLRWKYGFSPATFGRINEKGEALEKILTMNHEICADEALDYILLANEDRTDLKINVENTKVEPLSTEGEVFTQISDHAGVETSFYY